ncbi:type I-E CRISPR-associated endoribonuclease Cas2 [bacterium]|nr:type I-E CRISPR-associated endoribonuclease Cas2 [bacterium]
MVVIVLEKCPAALRGDLTKWLQEASVGVYVGHVSARVRDELWDRVCSEAKSGRATMVFSARNEQRYEIRVHNTCWEPVDFDGLTLMMRPSVERVQAMAAARTGCANIRVRGHHRSRRASQEEPGQYVIVDVETTGLDPRVDQIIEIGAIKVINGEMQEAFQKFVKPDAPIPDSIVRLTGITNELIDSEGVSPAEALVGLYDYVGFCPIVAHNASFDISFIDALCERLDVENLDNRIIDTLDLARKRVPNASSYKLGDIAAQLGVAVEGGHRAVEDCLTTRALFLKLIEK